MLTLVTGKFTFLLVAAGDTSIVQRTAGLTLVDISGLGVHDTPPFCSQSRGIPIFGLI